MFALDMEARLQPTACSSVVVCFHSTPDALRAQDLQKVYTQMPDAHMQTGSRPQTI